jgi:hypothetical protein
MKSGFRSGSSFILKLPVTDRAFGGKDKGLHVAPGSPSDFQLGVLSFEQERGAEGTNENLVPSRHGVQLHPCSEWVIMGSPTWAEGGDLCT